MAADYTARRVAVDDLLCPSLAPLFWRPQRVGAVSSWWTHVPFAHWLVHEARPRTLVELGTHNGVSYSAFCQAVLLSGLSTRCHAVDTWRGDPQSGEYGEEVYDAFRRFHDDRFAAFSTLLRCTFDEALGAFADKSLDVLHIDGYHAFDAVTHDFESWLPKLSDQAVVLLHDTNERRDDFGVWRLFEELRERYPAFEFLHGHGLGVLAAGAAAPPAILDLCTLSDPASVASVRARFASLGECWRRDTEFQIFEREARRQLEAAAALATDTKVELDRTVAEAQSQVEQARAEAQAQVEQARAEAQAQVEQARARAQAQAVQACAEAQAQAGQVRAETERACEAVRRAAEGRVAREAARANAAKAAAEASSHRVAAIEGSTLWRATAPLRKMAERFPRARKETRRVLRVAYGSLQLPQRLRDRRAQQARTRAVAESPLFNRDWYLARYPDVAAAGMDAAEHYVCFGAAEGRSPGPDFDTAAYVSKNPDVAAAAVNPLLHYTEYGIAEGRDASPVDPYARWVREFDTLDDADRAAIRAHIAGLARRPLISVVVPAYNTDEQHLRDMINSVWRQIYPHWELCIADDASTRPHVWRILQEFATLDHRIKIVRREVNGHICAATNSALDLATGEFIALLDHDDMLAEQALYEVAVEFEAHPDADVVYSDSDHMDDSGRRWAPYFKTDWDPDLMLGHNMVSHLGVYRRSLLESVGRLRVGFEGSQDYDLMLRMADATTPSRIRHVAAILYHWRRNSASPSFSESGLERCVVAARRAIRGHLVRSGARAHIELAPRTISFTRVVYALPDKRPLVSVIVPTRDRADLLARCADGILTRTDYEPLELVIMDNDSREPETHRLLADLGKDPRVRVLQHPGDFNYAAINNNAVRAARGEIVVLLNNDVDMISSLWLEEMVSHALRPDVGAVGAKLLYPDGRVQHAGVVLGVGHGAGHFFHQASREDVGHFGLLVLTRRVSAVTAACMALRRSVYLEVGGMNETDFPVAFNDVDLCLRIGELGHAIVWTPHAELYHFESATRGADAGGAGLARLEKDAVSLRQRWGSMLTSDPHYNPNCSIEAVFFEPGFPPRRDKPWLIFKQPALAPSVGMSRAERLLGPIDRSARIIEIGPSYNPIAPKSLDWNTRTLDHTTRASLVEKYRGHPGVDVDRIEEVDFVWTGGSMLDAVPSDLHGTFDAFIASHVIEHTTDLVGFLDAAATLLTSAGIVVLAVPDKRYCFDYFRPLSTTGDVLEAHAARRSRHSRRAIFNHTAYVVKNGGNGAWGQAPMQAIDFFHSLDDAGSVLSTVGDDPNSPYVDTHAWQFTPASFELLLVELARLGETDWLVERITPATGCEFYAWLRRGGQAAAAALAAPELEARRLELLKKILLQTKEQIDFFVAGETQATHAHG